MDSDSATFSLPQPLLKFKSLLAFWHYSNDLVILLDFNTVTILMFLKHILLFPLKLRLPTAFKIKPNFLA